MSRRKAGGRPSKVAAHRDLLTAELHTHPAVTGADLFALAKRHGYTGGQSAIYAFAAALRMRLKLPSAAEQQARAKGDRARERASTRAMVREQRRADIASRRERIDAEVTARRAERAAADEAHRAAREREREERLLRSGELLLEHFRPLAEDEQSTKLRVLVRTWLDSREATHKTCVDDRSRWRVHLASAFGDLEPAEVDAVKVRAFVEERLVTGLGPTTVRNCIALLSTFFTDLVDQGRVARNPIRPLPRSIRRLIRGAHDPKTTPFLERMTDVAKVRAALTGWMRALFSVGVMSGMRTGELVALQWGDVHLGTRVIHVQRRYRNGKLDTPKSGKGRAVPMSPGLVDVLAAWKEESGGGAGLVFPSPGGTIIDPGNSPFRKAWRAGLECAGLPRMKFYHATRHTFASQWVMAGRPIAKLSKILGHSTVLVTERYAHLKPESIDVPDLISFDQRIAEPKVSPSTLERLTAELAESRGQVSRLTELLAQQTQALNQLLAGRRKVAFAAPSGTVTVPEVTT